MGVEVIAGQFQSVVEVQLERRIGGLALALNGAVVKANVLATHEHAVGLPVTIYIDTAVRILHDAFRNGRPVPRPDESVVGGRAVTVLAVENNAILVKALARVGTRAILAHRAVPSGIGKVTVHQKAPATIVVERDETTRLRPGFAGGAASLSIGRIVVGETVRQIPGPIGV